MSTHVKVIGEFEFTKRSARLTCVRVTNANTVKEGNSL